MALYLVVAIVLNGCADRLILFPSRQPIRDLVARQMTIPGPAGKLEIYTMPSLGAAANEPKAFVLAFVGNASRAEWDAEQVAEQWGQRPVMVWAVNYPGYGHSEGKAKLASIAPSALAAFDAIKAQAGGKPIFVAGRSIGTAAALYVAAHRPVNGVILHSPPPLRCLIMGQFGWWNLWLAAVPVSLGVPADLDSIENAKHASAPAIFIITGGDSLVPPPYQQKVLDAYAGPKRAIVMPGVDHNDAIPAKEAVKIGRYLDELLSGGTF
jgi:hypothetical protein